MICEKILRKVLCDYSHAAQEYLNSDNFYGENAATLRIQYHKVKPTPEVPANDFSKMDISASINHVIKHALSGLPDYAIDKRMQIGDTFVFGDVHGQLDLFIQNLYMAGLIDKKGNLKKTNDNKTIVQCGDVINRGPFSWETVIYLNFLQKQGEEMGVKVLRCLGNHEYYLISHFQHEKPKEILQEILKKDILERRLCLTQCDQDKRILYFHGGMQKDALVKALSEMALEEKYPKLKEEAERISDIKLKLIEKHKIKHIETRESRQTKMILDRQTSSESIYKLMDKTEVSLMHLSDWMNRQLVELVASNNYKVSKEKEFLYTRYDGIVETSKKSISHRHPERMAKGSRSFVIGKFEKKYRWKPIQFTGHTPTDFVASSCGYNGGIKQNKANIFTDAGLVLEHGANQAYVMIDKKKDRVFAVEMRGIKPEIFFDEANMPFGLDSKAPHFKIRRLEGIRLYNQNAYSKKILPLTKKSKTESRNEKEFFPR